ncbi:MAG: glycosyltransferase, partial [Candidatus Aenigmarchaeota archaeon]|nr:glycosyltransferase [Candidatus Aenigmarchaeota archaeon]
MIESINGFLEWGYGIYMIWSPPVHEMSLYLYEVLFFPMLFFSSLFYIFAFSGLFTNPRPLVRPVIKSWPRVSIHIPTLNEIVAIRCARKCLKFDYPRNRYEIIIGDDSDNREISRKIDAFARKHRDMVRVTRRAGREGFKAGNLNNMVRHSSGEIIVNFDSDFLPPSDFLRKVVPSFAQDKKMAFVQS